MKSCEKKSAKFSFSIKLLLIKVNLEKLINKIKVA